MSSPKISVIVPLYKAEAYLHYCVDSLLAQTFLDFKVLLVDDGNPDRFGEICGEYVHRDSWVQVFHDENGGVSPVRQTEFVIERLKNGFLYFSTFCSLFI